MRVLALGDSYTAGEGVPAADAWPARLAAALAARGLAIAPPQVVARTGWTVGELAAALTAGDPGGPFALVTLLAGVNDQYRGGTPAAYRPAFRALLARAVALAGGRPAHVVVISIPDWGVTPFAAGRDRAAIARALDAFNRVARAEAARAGARWVDVTAISRRHGADPAFLAADGLHPGAAAYAEWTRAILPEAEAALRAP